MNITVMAETGCPQSKAFERAYFNFNIQLMIFILSTHMLITLCEIGLLFFLIWLISSLPIKRTNEGSISMINPSTIKKYIDQLDQTKQNYRWHSSVKRLQKVINFDPIIRLNWEYGISKSQNLQKKNGKDVLGLLNTIISVGPKFTGHKGNPYGVGFPINVLFIHLMQTQNGRALFSNPTFNKALKQVLNQYAKMLNSTASLTYLNNHETDSWFSSTALSASQDYSLFKCDPTQPNYGFKSWHQWFLRQFKEGARIVGAGSPKFIPEDDIIVSPCQFKALLHPIQPAQGVNGTSPFWLKDEQYSMRDMFGREGVKKGYWSLFEEGTVFQAFLDALSYHHWHSPLDGTIIDIYKIPGTYYFDHSQFLQCFDYSSPDQSQSFISATATKMVIILQADNPKIGQISIHVGMAECSGVHSSKMKGVKVKKGEHIGNFQFGGSSCAMLFQKSALLSFVPDIYHIDKGVKESRIIKVNSFLAYVS